MGWTESPLDGERPQGFSESQSQSWTTHVAEAIWLVGSSGSESSLKSMNSFVSPDLCRPMSRAAERWQMVVGVASLVAVQTLLVLVIAAWLGF